MVEQHLHLPQAPDGGVVEELREIELELSLAVVDFPGVGVGLVPEPEGVGPGEVREYLLLGLVVLEQGFVELPDLAEPEHQHLLFPERQVVHRHLIHHVVVLLVVLQLYLVPDIVANRCVRFH